MTDGLIRGTDFRGSSLKDLVSFKIFLLPCGYMKPGGRTGIKLK